MNFTVEFKTRWSDFDANVHMRHTAYNDYAAESRMRLFNKYGITIHDLAKEKVGPVLFEEYTSFRKEIHMGEDITVSLRLLGLSENGERWKIEHKIFNSKGQLSAVINVYGAWLDLVKRKLTFPPKKIKDIFDDLDKTETFEKIPLKREK